MKDLNKTNGAHIMYKMIDLFEGARGLSMGFERMNKFKVVAVIENNKNAYHTYMTDRKRNKIKEYSDIR